MTNEEVSNQTTEPVSAEMSRIKKLFYGLPGDREDLITYAKEIVRLRSAQCSNPKGE